MRLSVLAVGQRMPAWVQCAWDEYAKRFPRELQLDLLTVKAESRLAGRTPAQMMHAEAERLRKRLPATAHVIVLDERGQSLTTRQLADRLRRWKHLGADLAFLIGGPDGLDDALKAQADECLRLSDLTLPHAMVRVVLIEQLYRAWTITAGHPYHRA